MVRRHHLGGDAATPEAVRRTLFLLPRIDVPIVQAAVSTPLAAVLRRRLIARLKRNGTQPPVNGDLETWLSSLQAEVEQALRTQGSAAGADLAADIPALHRLAAGDPSASARF
jgi:hypothetical protein